MEEAQATKKKVVHNKMMLLIAVVGLLMEISFGTLPLWPGIESFNHGYTFQNKQFYYTFIVLGIFGCMLGVAGAIMDHKFVLIGTIWLCSFTAASYIIKLSWELISMLIMYLQSNGDLPLDHWPMLVKYAMSILFYALLTLVAYRACDEILASFFSSEMLDPNAQLTDAYIDSVYAKISNSMKSRTLDAELIKHRNQLHTLLYQASNSSRSNTGQSTNIDMQNARNWTPSGSFQQGSIRPQYNPNVVQRVQSARPIQTTSLTNENTYLMVNQGRSLPPPVPSKPPTQTTPH